jgi:hypothetical protein
MPLLAPDPPLCRAPTSSATSAAGHRGFSPRDETTFAAVALLRAASDFLEIGETRFRSASRHELDFRRHR